MQGCIVQAAIVDRHELHQVARRQYSADLEDVLRLIEPQFADKNGPMQRIHVWPYFESHDRGEPPLQDFRLDQLQQVVCFFLIAFGVRVACDSEQLDGGNRQSGKQHVQVLRHHVFEKNEMTFSAHSQQTRNALADRYLHPRDHRFGTISRLARHQQIERQV